MDKLRFYPIIILASGLSLDVYTTQLGLMYGAVETRPLGGTFWEILIFGGFMAGLYLVSHMAKVRTRLMTAMIYFYSLVPFLPVLNNLMVLRVMGVL